MSNDIGTMRLYCKLVYFFLIKISYAFFISGSLYMEVSRIFYYFRTDMRCVVQFVYGRNKTFQMV